MNEQPERRGPGAAGAVLALLAAVAVVLGLVVGRPMLDERERAPRAAPEAAPTFGKPSGRRPGVVAINTEQGYRMVSSAGTGIVLDASGLVLTNNHVIQGATRIEGTDTDNRRTYPAEVVGYDTAGDLAVIRLKGAGPLKVAALGSGERVRIGEPVTAVGNSNGKADRGRPKVVTGRVLSLDQTIDATDQSDGSSERLYGLIETDAPIRPGDSGGPLLNSAGKVIGVNTAASAGFTMKRQGGNRGYAIPVDRAMGIARQIQRGEASASVHIGPTAMLGVQVRTAPGSSGAFISETLPGTPAEAAGLRPKTTIVAVDGRPVDSPGTLTDLLLAQHPGDTVQITWADDQGRRTTTPIRLAEGPPQ
ncbi:S1C family serine protease [Spirillospora sp. CA-294931]|uniref:S1C family serine protease n=1 Tax=Spirillospora sp. CA-294931 TaxID=3240042 RepID=UPI003D8AF9C2